MYANATSVPLEGGYAQAYTWTFPDGRTFNTQPVDADMEGEYTLVMDQDPAIVTASTFVSRVKAGTICSDNATWTDIAGATSPTYTIGALNDAGSTSWRGRSPKLRELSGKLRELSKKLRELSKKLRELPKKPRELPKKLRELSKKLRELSEKCRELSLRLSQRRRSSVRCESEARNNPTDFETASYLPKKGKSKSRRNSYFP
jgi:hypothetical protein